MELSSIIARMLPSKVTCIHAIVGMGEVESSSIIVELLPLRAAGICASEGMGGVELLSIVTEPSPSGAVCIHACKGMGVVCGMVNSFLDEVHGAPTIVKPSWCLRLLDEGMSAR